MLRLLAMCPPERRFLRLPQGSSPRVLVSAQLPPARSLPSPHVALASPSHRARTTHPSCRRHGPERKREGGQEGATSHREQAPPTPGPLRLSAQRLVRGWRLSVENKFAPLLRIYVLFICVKFMDISFTRLFISFYVNAGGRRNMDY